MSYLPLIIPLLILLVLLIWACVYLHKDARRIYYKLDEFRQDARKTKDILQLELIRGGLLKYAKKECWHRHLWQDAINVLAFIDGKLSVIRNENEKKFAK